MSKKAKSEFAETWTGAVANEQEAEKMAVKPFVSWKRLRGIPDEPAPIERKAAKVVGKGRKLKPSRHGWLRWQWLNKSRTVTIEPWLVRDYHTNIGLDQNAAAVNSRITSDIGPLGHAAWEQIREALTYEGLVKIGTSIVDPDHVRATGDEGGIRLLLIMSRYEKWRETLADDPKTLRVVELYAKELLPAYQIEKEVRIRNGSAISRLIVGLEAYAQILRIEKGAPYQQKPAKPVKIPLPEFVWTRIVPHPQGTIKKPRKKKFDNRGESGLS